MSEPFNDPLLAAAMNTAHQGLKSGQEIGERAERKRAKPLLEALDEIAALHETYENAPAFERSPILHDARNIARAAIAAYTKGKA